MVKFVLAIKLKMDNILFKTNLPTFQYSTIPLFHIRGKLSSLKKCPIFSLSCRNSETFNYRKQKREPSLRVYFKEKSGSDQAM